MKSILSILFVLLFTGSFAQNVLFWNKKQLLKWKDFKGEINEKSPFDAESFAEVCFTYKFNSPKDFYFEVFAHFNKNSSWRRKELQSPELLKHEQVHFDIAQLFANKLKAAFENYQYSKDFVNEVLQIFNQKKVEYHLMQNLYDKETDHSLNTGTQKDWEKWVAAQLDAGKSESLLVRMKQQRASAK